MTANGWLHGYPRGYPNCRGSRAGAFTSVVADLARGDDGAFRAWQGRRRPTDDGVVTGRLKKVEGDARDLKLGEHRNTAAHGGAGPGSQPMPNIKTDVPIRLRTEPGELTLAELVFLAVLGLDGKATLTALYGLMWRSPRVRELVDWKAKIRHTLRSHPATFCRVGRDTWGFVSEHSPEELEKFERLYRERHPKRTRTES